MRLSQRSARAEASGIRRMFDLGARLKDPIDLSIGQPDFDPPAAVQEAAIRAIQSGKNRYTPTGGLPELTERILDRVAARTGVRPEACMMTAGVAGGLTLAFLALMDAEDAILIPDPWFVCYENLGKIIGPAPAHYVTYPDFRITDERLEAGMREDVKVLLVNTPGNPTGTVISQDELKVAAAFAKRHNLAVISDEIYDEFAFDGPVPSILEHHPEALLLGGYSKTLGIPGWRLGFACGPRDLIDRMKTIQQFTFVCAPSVAQHAALAAFDVDMEPYIAAYRKKRDLLVDGLSPAFELVKPGGAFYAFPKVPGMVAATEFAERAIERNMLVVPGRTFSSRDTHLRLSFALSDEKLARGIEGLNALADEFAGDR